MANDKSNIDSILTYILIKKLITPTIKSKAYKLGLIDKQGRIIKKPETEDEKNVLTIFDKFIFKLKRLLGTRLLSLNRFLYLHTLNNDFYSKLIVKGTVEQRAEIQRIKKDVSQMTEKYDKSMDEFLIGLINEDLREELK